MSCFAHPQFVQGCRYCILSMHYNSPLCSTCHTLPCSCPNVPPTNQLGQIASQSTGAVPASHICLCGNPAVYFTTKGIAMCSACFQNWWYNKHTQSPNFQPSQQPHHISLALQEFDKRLYELENVCNRLTVNVEKLISLFSTDPAKLELIINLTK